MATKTSYLRTLFMAVSIFFICLFVVPVLLGTVGKSTAYAAFGSGTSGTVSWSINSDGLLTLTPTSGDEGTLEGFHDGWPGSQASR